MLSLPGASTWVERFPYALVTELHADCLPFALVQHSETGARHRIQGGAAATLMYLLARKHLEDEAAGCDDIDTGWVDSYELLEGIWGLEGDDAQERIDRLVRLIHRELHQAGFDPGILEQCRGCYRVRADHILVDGSSQADARWNLPYYTTDWADDMPTDPMIQLRAK